MMDDGQKNDDDVNTAEIIKGLKWVKIIICINGRTEEYLSSTHNPSIIGTGTLEFWSDFMTRYSRSIACAEGNSLPGLEKQNLISQQDIESYVLCKHWTLNTCSMSAWIFLTRTWSSASSFWDFHFLLQKNVKLEIHFLKPCCGAFFVIKNFDLI